ncbi:MAG: hypothetical protein F6K16_40360, partial [Symploca sp. SIO2B6]|nr:hypothetical protein [Symploca sp. SIO2B6]
MLKTVRDWTPWTKVLLITLMIMMLGLSACGGGRSLDQSSDVVQRMREVSPPRVIQSLTALIETGQTSIRPSVDIVFPKADQVLDDDTVSVGLDVNGLSLFQDEMFGLGPHLNLLLDNEFYAAVYDVAQPLVLTDLAPG